jgi:hypothetical protein
MAGPPAWARRHLLPGRRVPTRGCVSRAPPTWQRCAQGAPSEKRRIALRVLLQVAPGLFPFVRSMLCGAPACAHQSPHASLSARPSRAGVRSAPRRHAGLSCVMKGACRAASALPCGLHASRLPAALGPVTHPHRPPATPLQLAPCLPRWPTPSASSWRHIASRSPRCTARCWASCWSPSTSLASTATTPTRRCVLHLAAAPVDSNRVAGPPAGVEAGKQEPRAAGAYQP